MVGPVRYRKRTVPDGGWGWVVAFASCVIQILTSGTSFSFGIIFIDLIKYFHSSQAVTALVGSIQMTLMNIVGIVAVPFIHRFGWRVTTITGSIISGVGFGTSVLAHNVYILLFTYGILTGLGNGIMSMVSIVCIQQYFDKHRATANGIAIIGTGVGVVVFGIMSYYIISISDWQLMMAINGSATLILGSIAGALYKPLPVETVKIIHPVVYEGENKPQLEAIHEKSETSDVESDIDKVDIDKLAVTISIQKDSHFNYGSLSGSYDVVASVPVRRSVPILSTVPSLILTNELFDYELLEFPTSVECKIPIKIRRKYKTGTHCYQFKTIIKKMFDFSLFTNTVFNLFNFTILMFTFAVTVPFTFLPELAMASGTSYCLASLLIPVVGFTSIFSRQIMGCIADKFPRARFDVAGSLFTLLGIQLLLTPCFIHYYPLLIVYSVIFGILLGALFTLYPVILLDLLDKNLFDKSLTLMLITVSMATVTAAPLSGLMIDELGALTDLKLTFMAVGGLQIIGALTYFCIICVKGQVSTSTKGRKENPSKNKSESETSALIQESQEINVDDKHIEEASGFVLDLPYYHYIEESTDADNERSESINNSDHMFKIV